jgi:hypothetical protein
MGLLGFLISFPLVVRAAQAASLSGGESGSWRHLVTVSTVEIALAGAVIAADGNRRRLLAECQRRVSRTNTAPVSLRARTASGRQSVPA